MAKRPVSPRWNRSNERAELCALYAEADAILAGWTCACSSSRDPLEVRCCQFAITGREPYPTAVELEEVRHAMRIAGVDAASPQAARKLPLAELRPCPLLSDTGRCRIYASRPFGCRTFFCQGAEPPFGERVRTPRGALSAIGRRIADLSARFAPRDPQPRALTKALV